MEKLVRKIGLVAHDAMKKDLIEWVLWNSELLMGHKFYCTGTTGTLILEALREKHPDVEWDFTILKSGPLGGDQQMGSRIVDGEIDYLFFFNFLFQQIHLFFHLLQFCVINIFHFLTAFLIVRHTF